MGTPRLCVGSDILTYPNATYAPSGYIATGTAVTRWPISNINNGVSGLYSKIAGASAGFALDVQRNIAPQILAAFNTNFNLASSVLLQSASDHAFSSITSSTDVTSRAIALDDFWFDLSTLGLPSSRYWRLFVSGHTGVPALGEFLLATPSQVCPHYQWGYSDQRSYPLRDIGVSSLNVRHRRAYGAIVKQLNQVLFAGTRSQIIPIRNMAYILTGIRWPFLFVPNDDETDVRLLDFDGTIAENWPIAARFEMSLSMVSQGNGILA